ncbi:hypothetical protein JOD29_002141 [Lysinibacillus composti]|uniref:Uncharacterized protein n=1 Tax=Lysinibacillus composti TaxID=720633 RepID=A0A3N9UE17_9BACI|nr:hypothetical protein [Lysinibacillus composti]MBM7608875.1 hypothetical protein [Lysinibacillus composti]RQW74455.1 hypothetical protein EBB45_11235 [Lysinibacillus composti]
MTLKAIANKLFVINLLDWSALNEVEQEMMQQERNAIVQRFVEKAGQENSIFTLKAMIEYDKANFFLPVQCIISLYQRLIFLAQSKDSNNYLDFAKYLRLYGSDWYAVADEIESLIGLNEIEEAFKIVMEIRG